MMRRRKNAMEWTWVLNALLNGAVTTYSHVRPQQLWTIHGDVFDPVWSTRSYSIPGSRIFADRLSDHDALLPVIPAAAYFSNVLSPAHAGVPLDAFSLPDNLDDLVAAFLRLNDDRRRRFLRVATTIYLARQLWDTSVSSYFLGCVQAIETLIEPPERVPCPTCNRDTGPGAARLFREFVETHCVSSGIDQAILKQLYKVRSALAHGDYLFQLDEAPWALNTAARVASDGEQDIHMAALTVAKTGLRSWLMNQPTHQPDAPAD